MGSGLSRVPKSNAIEREERGDSELRTKYSIALVGDRDLQERFYRAHDKRMSLHETEESVRKFHTESKFNIHFYLNMFETPDKVSQFDFKMGYDPATPNYYLETWEQAVKELISGVSNSSDAYERIPKLLSNYVRMQDYKYSDGSKPTLDKILNEMFETDLVSYSAILEGFKNTYQGLSPYKNNSELWGELVPMFSNEKEKVAYKEHIANTSYIALTNLTNLDNIVREALLPQSTGLLEEFNLGEKRYLSSADDNALAYYMSDDKSISIYLDTMDLEGKHTAKTGFTVSDASAGLIDTITHEYGHSLHYSILMGQFGTVDPFNTFEKYEYLFDWSNEPAKYQAVSEYGNYNKKEAFAEAFTMYTTGVEPTMGKEYFHQFKSLMSDLKLTKLHGINSVKNTSLFAPEAPTTPTTVKATTLQNATLSKPAKTVMFFIKGKEYNVIPSATSLKQGYIRKRVNGTDYVIDVKTGEILRRLEVKK